MVMGLAFSPLIPSGWKRCLNAPGMPSRSLSRLHFEAMRPDLAERAGSIRRRNKHAQGGRLMNLSAFLTKTVI
jgi:hypothetical protein